jgi:hypothetical protein
MKASERFVVFLYNEYAESDASSFAALPDWTGRDGASIRETRAIYTLSG